MKATKRVLKALYFIKFQYVILGEEKSTRTVDEAKNLISIEEPEKFENEVQDENEGEFHLSLLFMNNISLKSTNI